MITTGPAGLSSQEQSAGASARKSGFDSDINALAGSASFADAVEKAGETWKGPYGLKLDWAIPGGYAEHFVQTGGRPLTFVQSSALVGAEIGSDAKFLSQADWIFDTGKIARVAGPASRFLGPLSLAGEAAVNYSQPGHGDAGDWGHLGFGTVMYAAGFAVSAPVGLTVGLAWGVSDYFVHDFQYQGQTGWRALGHSYNDQMEQVYKFDPNFYRGPKI